MKDRIKSMALSIWLISSFLFGMFWESNPPRWWLMPVVLVLSIWGAMLDDTAEKL